MTKVSSRTKTRPILRKPAGVPVPIRDLEQTREIPAVPSESEETSAQAPSAVPQKVIPVEPTVPVQSCIERTLLHEILRRESAEGEEDEGSKPKEDG